MSSEASTSTSPRSAFPSPRSSSSRDQSGKIQRLPRARCLKRDCRWEPIAEAHLRYLYRAYKRGELPDFPLPGDLGPVEFQVHILAIFQALADRGGEMSVFINHHGEPIGLVGVQFQTIYDRRRAFPHALWFKEGTARQRLECALRFLLNLKKTNLVVIEATEPNWRLFQHLCLYGALRRVGTIRDAYGAGGRTAIYQGVGK